MIDVNELMFTYPRAVEPTVRSISFQVEEGEIFGFLGPSGAGKSTTQKVLIGLLREYQGRARVLGREVSEWGADFYEHVGVSFELPNHYLRLTALENLEHFAALYSNPTHHPREVLRWLGLESDADKRVADFSKGMKVRLGLARSLLHRPRLLFLDEPTSGLDPVNARAVKDLIEKVRGEGTTVFLTTHDMAVAEQLCDRVAFIAEGRLAAVDAPDALKQAHGRRVVRVQYEVGRPEPACQEFPLDALGSNAAFLDLLKDRSVQSIHSQEATLESVFIQVTGHELTADTALGKASKPA